MKKQTKVEKPSNINPSFHVPKVEGENKGISSNENQLKNKRKAPNDPSFKKIKKKKINNAGGVEQQLDLDINNEPKQKDNGNETFLSGSEGNNEPSNDENLLSARKKKKNLESESWNSEESLTMEIETENKKPEDKIKRTKPFYNKERVANNMIARTRKLNLPFVLSSERNSLYRCTVCDVSIYVDKVFKMTRHIQTKSHQLLAISANEAENEMNQIVPFIKKEVSKEERFHNLFDKITSVLDYAEENDCCLKDLKVSSPSMSSIFEGSIQIIYLHLIFLKNIFIVCFSHNLSWIL